MLSQKILESEIRCELCKSEPDFVQMPKSKESFHHIENYNEFEW